MNMSEALPETIEPPYAEEDAFAAHNTRLARAYDPARLLLVGPAWVGDMVMAQVLLQVMRRRWPKLQIDVLAPLASLPVASRMAEVRRGIPLDIPHGKLGWKERRRIAETLQKEDYDWSICLPNSLKSALVPYWAQIPNRSGFGGNARKMLLNDRHHLDKKRLPRTVDRFVALGLPRRLPQPKHLPAPRLMVDHAALAVTLQRLNIQNPGAGLVALAPGAEYGPAKRWPVRHWISLARQLTQAGRPVWLFGSPKDTEITQAIAQAVPTVLDLGGRTSLTEVIDLLSLAEITVSNDSGLMHIAGAVGSRVIALYGSTHLQMTPPLSPGAVALRLGLSCSPCGKRECPLKHHRCMEDLLPEQVLQQLSSR
ncbi:MAG: lipopolysaccharide heptosyltransferase II [Acidithiobacillaceae bacterium]|nr:lipopolysaccharide heptosyltransferase II [Acidithiobacillaceae bacterium]